jgi:EpsI family protein
MRSPELRKWAPVAVLGLGAIAMLLVARQQTIPLPQPLSGLPTEMVSFRGKDLPISEAEQAIAGMSSFVFRLFEDGKGAAFSIYVGYYESQTQGKTIHSPKNCLPGAGWEPIEAGTTSVPVGGRAVQVNRYLLGKESSTVLVYYWYQGRGRVAANEYLVKWNLLRDKALSGRSEESLVRIVVPFRGAASVADSLATRIAAELIPEVDAHLPSFPGRPALKS